MSVPTPATFGNANHRDASLPERPFTFVEVPASRSQDLIELDQWCFPSGASPEVMAQAVKALVPERNVGVELVGQSDSRLVAIHSSYAATLPTPGGSVAASGLTWVGVHPQFRRRGVLTAMIDRHFTQCAERNEAVSALFAAEMSIYQRFGYAQAGPQLSLTIPRGPKLWDVPGAQECTVRLEIYQEDRHADLIDQLYREVGPECPGWLSRDLPQYLRGVTFDPPSMREKRESLRLAVVERKGMVVGYAFFVRKLAWGAGGPDGSVHIFEPVVKDAAAARALWGVLLDLDLVTTATIRSLAQDDPLMSLLVDPRAAVPARSDNLHIRILDLPTALTQRSYQMDFSVILAVTDAQVAKNQGTWRISSASGEVTVVQTHEAAELSLDIRTLAAVYLGGRSLTEMARAGQLVVHSPTALATASIAFGSQRAPHCPWDF